VSARCDPDGNQLLIAKAVDRPGALPMQVITNVLDVLNQKVGK
jgi:hypothetical protein